jgi:hypothetical protein
MGPPEGPTNSPQNQGTNPWKGRKRPKRRPRMRRCLLKGCDQRYHPRQARQRYCSARCREAARAWSRSKAQEKYRATVAGKGKRNGQSRRYRERVRERKPSEKTRLRRSRGSSLEIFFRSFLRPARVLREVRAPPSIAKTAVLLKGVSARVGACLGAGAALEGEADRVKKIWKQRPPRRRVEAATGLTTSAPRSSRHIDGVGGAG